MTDETILTNATLLLPDRVLRGTLVLCGPLIADIQPGRSTAPGAVDLGGDALMPGVVDVHTDNLERQVYPRSNARWPSRSAMMTHDAQCAAAGVTTVLDALCLGDIAFDKDRVRTFREGVADLDALGAADLFKADHYLHLRCEVAAADMPELFASVADHPRVRMVSLMDHTPGFGQYIDLDRYRRLRRQGGASGEEIERRIVEMQATRTRLRDRQRRALLAALAGRDVAVASHDDRSEADIAENAADGIRVSEFPVTLAAAQAAKRAGMQVVAGAPNLVRGGSHSGNVPVAALLAAGAVDALASDYVPSSLIEAAFHCAGDGRALSDAVALVTERPARLAGLLDRGRLAVGWRADLVRVRVHEELPVVRQVWRAGERVA